MSHPIHHFHKRKRIHQQKEAYPNNNSTKRIVDMFVYAAGIISPLAAIPQVTKIWIEQEAGGISVFMFATHLATNIIWLYYGYLHKERPIIILYALWLVMNSLIVVGTLLYG